MENCTKLLLPTPKFEIKSNEPVNNNLQYRAPSGMTLHQQHKRPRLYKPISQAPTQINKTKSDNENQNVKSYNNRWTTDTQTVQHCPYNAEKIPHQQLQRDQQYNGHKRFNQRWNNSRPAPVSKMKEDEVVPINSDLLEQIKKLNTPEEIQAWREERRKKYPTLANVQMRQKAQEQRQKRGERLTPNKSRFGKHKDRRQMQRGAAKHNEQSDQTKDKELGIINNESNENNNQTLEKNQDMLKNKRNDNSRNKRRRNRKGYKNNTKNVKKLSPSLSQEKTVNENVVAEVQECGGIPMFQGTRKLQDYKHEDWRNCKVNALSALFTQYGSDDDEEYSNYDDNEKQTDLHNAAGYECIQSEIKSMAIIIDEKEETNLNCQSDNNCSNVETGSITRLEYQTIQPIESVASSNYAERNEVPKDCLESENATIPNTLAINAKNTNESVQNAEDDYLKNASAEEAPDEAPISHTDEMPIIIKPTKPQEPLTKSRLSCKRKFGLDYRKAHLRKQNTMLEKLLASDIRHERNVLLQCVRFVCENNFFDVDYERKN